MSDSLSFQNGIAAYSEYLEHEQHASQSTRSGYASYLRRFHRYLIERYGPKVRLTDPTTDDVRTYLDSLSRQGFRPRTLRGAMYPIRGLFAMALERGYVTSNPALAVKLPKKDAARRETITDSELEQLLAGTSRESGPRRREMLRALLAILIYGGLRRQEVLDLQLGDVDLNAHKVIVRSGKGSKERTLFVCQACVDAIRSWLAVRPKAHHPYVFVADVRRRLGEEGLRKLVESAKSLADLSDHANIKPHSMRHACATRMLRNGADLRSIQHFLGHASLHTTAIYLHTDEEQMQRIAELGDFRPQDPTSSSCGPTPRKHIASRPRSQPAGPRLVRHALPKGRGRN